MMDDKLARLLTLIDVELAHIGKRVTRMAREAAMDDDEITDLVGSDRDAREFLEVITDEITSGEMAVLDAIVTLRMAIREFKAGGAA